VSAAIKVNPKLPDRPQNAMMTALEMENIFDSILRIIPGTGNLFDELSRALVGLSASELQQVVDYSGEYIFDGGDRAKFLAIVEKMQASPPKSSGDGSKGGSEPAAASDVTADGGGQDDKKKKRKPKSSAKANDIPVLVAIATRYRLWKAEGMKKGQLAEERDLWLAECNKKLRSESGVVPLSLAVATKALECAIDTFEREQNRKEKKTGTGAEDAGLSGCQKDDLVALSSRRAASIDLKEEKKVKKDKKESKREAGVTFREELAKNFNSNDEKSLAVMVHDSGPKEGKELKREGGKGKKKSGDSSAELVDLMAKAVSAALEASRKAAKKKKKEKKEKKKKKKRERERERERDSRRRGRRWATCWKRVCRKRKSTKRARRQGRCIRAAAAAVAAAAAAATAAAISSREKKE
jgi:hypothetical protein